MARMEIDESSLRRFVTALTLESDGRALANDFRAEMRHVAEPAAAAARGAILSYPSRGLAHGESLRTAIANAIAVQASISKRHPGVGVVAKKTPRTRQFAFAARRTNAKKWRHKVFGKGWVYQVSARPGWFDDAVAPFAPAVREGAARAVATTLRRISRRDHI